MPLWNRHDVEAVLAFYDDAITWRNVALEETYEGKEQVAAFLERMFAAFPDLTFEVTWRMARGDEVAETWRLRGTHQGTFLGLPPTRRPVEIDGMSAITMRNGKFLRDEFLFDSGTVLRQLGILPSLAAAQTRAGRAVLGLVVRLRRQRRARSSTGPRSHSRAWRAAAR